MQSSSSLLEKLPPTPLSKPAKGAMGKTGFWRTLKPVIDLNKCTKCGLCWLYCPEATVIFTKEEGPKIDYVYCKGCGICAEECPAKAIEMVREF